MDQCIDKVLCNIKEPEEPVSSNIEGSEESGTREFEGSGTEEFERSSIEKFEGSGTKESKALDNWWRRKEEELVDHHHHDYLGKIGVYLKNYADVVNGIENQLNNVKNRYDEKSEIGQSYERILNKVRKHLKDFDEIINLKKYWCGKEDLAFEFGKSKNEIIDDFIIKNGLKWIPYNKFKNIEYLNEGGFGIIYKATWKTAWNRDEEVILKCHKNLNDNLNEFLNEWEHHTSFLTSNNIIYLYGFTEDPNTSKYMVVMDYANKGNLRENLTRIVENNWNQKLCMLYEIISGLSNIHENNLIHCDFHDGNILNHNDKNKDKIYVSDLGLCRPVKSTLKKHDIYGVTSFMAPEVLRGKSYTQASDIYSFSMIMWEFTSGVSPFNNRAHDIQLSLSICKGERPEIIENTPQCYVDLMKKCWNEDPLKRPSTSEVKEVIKNWIFCSRNDEVSEELKSNIMEFIDAPIGHYNLTTKSCPKACYTSRLLDFTSKKLNEILESEGSQASVSEDLNDCVVRNSRSLDENISKKLNGILESEGSQASVSKDLNDCVVRDSRSLDEN